MKKIISNENDDNDNRVARLEQKIFYLESRISMLESNAIGFPIPYLENTKINNKT